MMRYLPALLWSAVALAAPAMAQPADLPIPPAAAETYPPGVKVGAVPQGKVYTDRAGRTLYGLDLRTVLRWSPDPAQYCTGPCAKLWAPLLAPSGATPNIQYPKGFGSERPAGFIAPEKAPDWTIMAGPEGPQWVYKGWHLVFFRRGDRRGSTEFDGAEGRRWNTLKFIPPVPVVAAPPGVRPVFVDGAYGLADRAGQLLYTADCHHDCAAVQHLPAPIASRGLREWTVRDDGDGPYWVYRGKTVVVKAPDGEVPAGALPLRPTERTK